MFSVETFPFLELSLAIIAANYLFENYIRWRQYSRMFASARPALLTDEIVSEVDFQSAQAYSRDKLSFAFFKDAFENIISVAVLFYTVLPLAWTWSGQALAYVGMDDSHEINKSVVFCFGLMWFNMLIDIPFRLYSAFVIEEKHGFNKQTIGLWCTDFVKSLGLNLIIGAPLLIAFLHIVKWGGQHFYLYVVAFQVIVQIVMIWLYPTFIQPCFNKVEPLREGDLKTKIEALAVRLNYPLKKLFEIDGSKRSSHSNAYQYGFCGSKHIVLFDTLLKNTPDDAIEAIVAHELGHWSHSHVLKMMCASVVNSTASLFLYGFALHCAPLFHAFGFHDEALPTIIGFTLAGYISAPLSQLLGFVFNNISRYFEFQADMFAVSQGMAKPLRVGLIQLGRENKTDFDPDWMYAAYHYSHPPLIERLRALDAATKKSE